MRHVGATTSAATPNRLDRLLRRGRHRGGGTRSTGLRARALVRIIAVLIALAMTATACGAGGAGGGAGNPNGQTSNKFLNFFPCCSWGTTWSFNPYNVNGLSIQNDYVVQRLAIQKFPSMNEFIPQLADEWTVEDGKVSVHIREGVTWQNGDPVTSQDLYDTAILNGLRGDLFWNDITDIEATDDQTVVFTLRKGIPTDLALSHLLPDLIVYPSSVYGKFVTDSLVSDVIAYFKAKHKNPTAAAEMPEFKRMSKAFQKLAALEVPELIGNGPFKLENITTKDAKLVKWDGYYDADKIKIAGINYQNGTTQTIYSQLFAGQVEFSNVYMPPPILKRWSETEDAQLALPPAFGFVLMFNNSRYPLNNKKVRQALAHVIPREQMTESAYGTDDGAGGVYKEVITGISPSLEELYLTDDQIGQLNPYANDLDKATQLLESEGFTKTDGQWITPKGKPFTMTLTANSETTDIVTAFDSAAKSLSDFGIKADVNATSGAQQDADQHNGNFDAGMAFVGGANPLGMYETLLGPGYNFSTQGNYAGKRGIGFGPTKNVPGLGTVNVPQTLTKQVSTVAPGQQMNDLTWSWAQMVNEEVPYIWYATKVYQFQFSTREIGNWPPVEDSGTSEYWDIIGFNMSAGIVWAMQNDFITPTD